MNRGPRARPSTSLIQIYVWPSIFSPHTKIINALQRRHVSVMASQITCHSSICSTIKWHPRSPAIRVFAQQSKKHQRNIKAPRYWTFVRGIHQWPVDSRYKGPVAEVSMFWCLNGVWLSCMIYILRWRSIYIQAISMKQGPADILLT